jgi:GT2 family glycosyltransferase
MMDISIIVVNYNTKKLLDECLKSLIKHTKKAEYEIIIVDNASTDGSVALLKKLQDKYGSKLKVITNKTNDGFGAANNQGIKIARGRYILLLNSDTKVTDNVVGRMIDWMDKNGEVGISSCALKSKDGSYQGTGGSFPDLLRVFNWMFFIENIPLLDKIIRPFHPMHEHSPFYKGESFYRERQEMDWVTGAFFMIRKNVVEDVGLFDRDYFMYVEELDYCYRAKKKGWRVVYNPKNSIIHYGGASSTEKFPIISEFEGVKTFYRKHMPKWQFPLLRIFLKGGAALRIIILGLLKGSATAKTYVKAFQIA